MNAASYVAEAGRGKLVKKNEMFPRLCSNQALALSKSRVPRFRIAIDEANRNAAVGMTDIERELGNDDLLILGI
jgi:hypothetical protein